MKTVLISGGSRGIGRAIVKKAAKAGYAVAFTYSRSDGEAAELVAELAKDGVMVSAYKADNADGDALKRVAQEVAANFGGIYALVNNAAVSRIAPLIDFSDEEISRMLAVNLEGAIKLTKAVCPYMTSVTEGKIVNVSSVWGVCGASCESVYSATKGGLIAFTKALAKELAPSKITVNCVCPGVTDTDMNAHLSAEERRALEEQIPLGRFCTPDEIADAVMFFINGADCVTGQVICVDGGFIV